LFKRAGNDWKEGVRETGTCAMIEAFNTKAGNTGGINKMQKINPANLVQSYDGVQMITA
jgi:hypothetical protein